MKGQQSVKTENAKTHGVFLEKHHPYRVSCRMRATDTTEKVNILNLCFLALNPDSKKQSIKEVLKFWISLKIVISRP